MYGATMQALDLNLPGSAVSLDREPSAEIAREFERQLGDGLVLAFRVALGVLRHREDAEDVAQEALLRAHGKFQRLRDPQSFRAWLAKISFRLALDRVRGRSRRERRETAWAAARIEPTAEGIAVSGEFQRRLDRALDELPGRLRLVLILAAIEGHGLKDVAELLDISEGTVKSRLFHARKRLAEKLEWTVNEHKRS
jgi:RNA polymerase sigma-70 factor, ECF subfamily